MRLIALLLSQIQELDVVSIFLTLRFSQKRKYDEVNDANQFYRKLLLSVNGTSMKSNIQEIFGIKLFKELIPFSFESELPRYRLYCTYISDDSGQYRIYSSGFITSAYSNSSRGKPDMQYFYINGRSCDIPKVLICNYNLVLKVD